MSILPIDEALPLLFAELLKARQGRSAPVARVGVRQRMTALDTFEIMVRIDDAATAAGLSGTSPVLERWSEVDCASLVEHLRREPGRFLLAVLLLLSPKGLARMASHLSFLRWMEVARALNSATPDQLAKLLDCGPLERYLTGGNSARPRLDLPWVFPLPAPSVLRIVQSTRFRLGLFSQEGNVEAMRRYVRFFC